MNSIEWLLEIPRRFGSREFLIDTQTGESVSFQGMHDAALHIGADLRRRGLKKGDRVVMVLNNSAAFAKLYFGCLYAGIVAVPINPVLSKREVEHIVTRCKARLTVVSEETAYLVPTELATQTGEVVLLDQHGLIDATGENAQNACSPEELDDSSGFRAFEGVTPDDEMSIVFTSGTTGMPTGVGHRIANMIDNARLFNKRTGIDESSRFYGVLAMTYLGGYYNLLVLPYCAGASVVLSRAFDARSAIDFWSDAKTHGVNTLWMVPTIMAMLMEMDRGSEGESFCRENVQLSLVGTAPLPLRLREDFEARYGVTMFENYGLCETFFVSTNAPNTPVLDGCVGRILPGVQVAVMNSEGAALAYGEEGEIHVCTPYLMTDCYEMETTQIDKLNRDDWFPTGDVGILSATGDLFITGRKKNLIIRGGINISPAAIEAAIYEHDSVVECAVVGIPHALYGEDIAAAVRLSEGVKIRDIKDELLALCREHLGATKQPAQIIELESFPHSSSGKIQHRKIRDVLVNKLGVGESETRQTSDDEIRGPLSLPGRLRRCPPRPPRNMAQKLGEFPTTIVSDVLNRLGSMDGVIHSLVRGRSFCGCAVTVEEVEGGNLMSHAALELVQAGDVLVIDAKGVTSRSCWGGLQTLMAQRRGVVGIVINGSVRDYDDILKLEMPVHAIATTSAGPLKAWGGNVNCPIACGGVVVNPGDIVVGDDDGVVVVPQDLAEAALECCQRRTRLEQTWVERVEAGETTVDVVGLRDKLGQLNLRVA